MFRFLYSLCDFSNFKVFRSFVFARLRLLLALLDPEFECKQPLRPVLGTPSSTLLDGAVFVSPHCV